jgi:hypothetical protein
MKKSKKKKSLKSIPTAVGVSAGEMVAAELVKVAKDLIGATFDEPNLGAFDGVQYTWPVAPRNWSVISYNKTDAFGDVHALTYQDDNTGEMVDFDFWDWYRSEGKRPGTWEIEAYGRKTSGKIKNLEGVVRVLKNLDKWLVASKNDAAKRSLIKVTGWDGPDISLMDWINYTYENKRDPHEEMEVDFSEGNALSVWDALLNNGKGEARMRYVPDYDYQGAVRPKERVVSWSGKDGIKKVLKEAEKFYKKHSDEWYG